MCERQGFNCLLDDWSIATFLHKSVLMEFQNLCLMPPHNKEC